MNGRERDNYGIELAEELELRDVPPQVVERIVREVSSHTADSGEDPLKSFGPPSRYADEFAPRSGPRRMLVPLAFLAAALGAGGGLMLLSGLFGFMGSSAELWGLVPSTRLTVGILLLASFVALVTGLAIRSRKRSASWKLM